MISVKKLLFTIALACTITASAAFSAVLPAFAVEENGETASAQTVYPSEFLREPVFGSVSDYAINGDSIAIADGTRLNLISTDSSSDKKMAQYDCGFEIIRLDYVGDELYIGNVEGNTYLFPETNVPCGYEFTAENYSLTIGDCQYLMTTDELMCFNSGRLESMGTGYTRLKEYEGKAYVLKANTIYKLDGTTATALSLAYTDFAAASEISTGNTKDLLLSDYSITTVTVNPTTEEGGATYCTEVDLSDLSGDKFIVGKTIKIIGTRSALAIAQTGNATIIVMNEESESKSYLVLSSALAPSAYTTPVPDMTNAYVLTGIKMYSRPYICGATEVGTLPQGTIVSVIEKFSLNFISTVFYKVSYRTAEGEICGFVAANYLSPYTFSAEQNQPESIKGEFSYENDMQTVIIVLMIIALVIIAIAYLTAVGTRNGGKKRRNNGKKGTNKTTEVQEEQT